MNVHCSIAALKGWIATTDNTKYTRQYKVS